MFIYLQGNFNEHTTPYFLNTVNSLISDSGIKNMVFNIEQTVINSFGINCLNKIKETVNCYYCGESYNQIKIKHLTNELEVWEEVKL